jgi:hypothetical protein
MNSVPIILLINDLRWNLVSTQHLVGGSPTKQHPNIVYVESNLHTNKIIPQMEIRSYYKADV